MERENDKGHTARRLSLPYSGSVTGVKTGASQTISCVTQRKRARTIPPLHYIPHRADNHVSDQVEVSCNVGVVGYKTLRDTRQVMCQLVRKLTRTGTR